jgi:hypothetical protein
MYIVVSVPSDDSIPDHLGKGKCPKNRNGTIRIPKMKYSLETRRQKKAGK